MTVEELEIIVTAKVEEALKEFKKLKPLVEQQVKQIQDLFSKVDLSGLDKQIDKAIKTVKSKMADLKNSNKDNVITIKVANEEAKKQIDQTKKQLNSLSKKTTSR